MCNREHTQPSGTGQRRHCGTLAGLALLKSDGITHAVHISGAREAKAIQRGNGSREKRANVIHVCGGTYWK